MAQGDTFSTQRAGNWSRPITFHDSPWWRSDAQDGASTGFYPTNGDTVVVRHNLTVNVDITIGLSLQAPLWSPLLVEATGGDQVTQLATGTYTLGASVVSSNGETQLAGTVASLSLVNGVSKPRVTFDQNPPTGCSYSLYLGDSSPGAHPSLYCSSIGGLQVDLVSASWGNNWVGGVASGGSVTQQDSTSPLPSGEANAVTVTAEGSVVIASGKRLLLRGDFVVESPTGSVKPFMQIGSGATFRTDPTQATDPTRADYLMWFQGGGDVRYLG